MCWCRLDTVGNRVGSRVWSLLGTVLFSLANSKKGVCTSWDSAPRQGNIRVWKHIKLFVRNICSLKKVIKVTFWARWTLKINVKLDTRSRKHKTLPLIGLNDPQPSLKNPPMSRTYSQMNPVHISRTFWLTFALKLHLYLFPSFSLCAIHIISSTSAALPLRKEINK
jgi:hypothetical protein